MIGKFFIGMALAVASSSVSSAAIAGDCCSTANPIFKNCSPAQCISGAYGPPPMTITASPSPMVTISADGDVLINWSEAERAAEQLYTGATYQMWARALVAAKKAK